MKTTSAKESTVKTTQEMREELAFYVKTAKKFYDDAQAKFIADIQTNPVSTITWSAEKMVKTQTDHEVWMRIERELADHEPREVLAENLKEVQYRVRSFFGSNSTSIFSNAVERARAEAYIRQAEQLEGLIKHFGI
jgi:hypothetical protein